MKLQVENLGAIKKGEIDLWKNLIILTGKNNVGKSYLSYLIYGFFKMCEYKTPDIRREIDNNILVNKYKELLDWELDHEHWLDKYWNEYGFSIPFTKFLEENYEKLYSMLYGKTLELSVNGLFASKDLQIKVKVVNLKKQLLDFKFPTIKGATFSIDSNVFILNAVGGNFEIIGNQKMTDSQKSAVRNLIHQYFILPNHFNTYFFPAERSAIHLFSNEIIKNKAEERDEIANRVLKGENFENIVKELRQKLLPRYPMALSDYIYLINDVKYIASQPETEFTDLATNLENILQGKISVNTYGDVQFIPQGQQKPLQLHLSSSLVKSLSGLVLYFRYLAKKNDAILIDEPELNFHPDNQRLIAKVLAKAANRSFRVILSTHSDYIIREFNNLIMLNKSSVKTEELKKRYDYQDSEILNATKVGVYLLENEAIKEVKIEESGFAIKAIDKVINEQNIASQDIYNTLFEEEYEIVEQD